AFTERFQADALGAKARQQGYTVVVVSATVNGKQYFRVRVVAGSSKGSAEELQEKLKKEGYPTIVVRL
ncbi:MAG TPA: SPOR domain-containing protein, partial [Synergistaceae bacterium]|nr:SPOR domain-containing protein [Synergistaceae bacterium]